MTDPHGLGLPIWALSELIEAAVRAGKPERAVDPLAQLAEISEASATDWALGSHARSAALLAEGAAADALYREALERLSRIHTRGCETQARTHLVYGEWLRREGRRVDAREQLRLAHERYTEMGGSVTARSAAANASS